MNVLVLGSGGREHALAWKLGQSPDVRQVWVSPGNGGTPCPPSAVPDATLGEWCRKHEVGLVVVGPEAPLAAGLVDRLQTQEVPVFGPTQAAARLESDKAFCKDFAIRWNIPTAAYGTWTDIESARSHLRSFGQIPVLKAAGLAGGKGVLVPSTLKEAESWLEGALSGRLFGDAGKSVVIEERLEGREISLMAFCDGSHYRLMPPVMDHKRLGDNDQGPNTGGMGTVAPPPGFDSAALPELGETFVGRALRGMAEDGCPFRGVLFAGLMLTPDGPRLLEYNCRFGDPETQTVMQLLRSDLMPVLSACVNGTLERVEPEWWDEAAATVVMCSRDYPGALTGLDEAIRGLPPHDSDVQVFHSGTRARDGHLVTGGGRVLAVSARAPRLDAALQRVYSVVEQIEFAGSHYRLDIGRTN